MNLGACIKCLRSTELDVDSDPLSAGEYDRTNVYSLLRYFHA